MTNWVTVCLVGQMRVTKEKGCHLLLSVVQLNLVVVSTKVGSTRTGLSSSRRKRSCYTCKMRLVFFVGNLLGYAIAFNFMYLCLMLLGGNHIYLTETLIF